MTIRRRQLTLPIDPERPTGWALLELLYCLARDAVRICAATDQLVTVLTMPPRRSPDSGAADRVLGHGPWRVFLSHTSELRDQPAERSFIAAAEAAVIRAGHAVTDMAYFAVLDTGAAEHCARMIARADLYVGIIGLRYGGLVHGRPELSYTELELEAATRLGIPRLIFLIREDAPALSPVSQSPEHAARQAAFRSRLRGAGRLLCSVATPADLELRLLQSLGELRTESAVSAVAQRRPGSSTPNRWRPPRHGRSLETIHIAKNWEPPP